MSRWWRAYDDALHDPKVQGLPPTLFKFWFNLLCVASKYGGLIPPLDELKTVLRARSDHVEAYLKELLKRGLVDEIDGRLEPHNWRKRQYKSDLSTPRVNQHREAKRNVSETPPDNRVQNTETDIKKESSLRSAAREQEQQIEREFSDWYADYPHKVGRAQALKAFKSVRRRNAATLAELKAGLARYVATKPPDRAWCNPATWLNGERWKDQPAPVAARSHGPPRPQQQSMHDLLTELTQSKPDEQFGPSGLDFDLDLTANDR